MLLDKQASMNLATKVTHSFIILVKNPDHVRLVLGHKGFQRLVLESGEFRNSYGVCGSVYSLLKENFSPLMNLKFLEMLTDYPTYLCTCVAMPFQNMRPENVDRAWKINKGSPDSVDISLQPQQQQLEYLNISDIPMTGPRS